MIINECKLGGGRIYDLKQLEIIYAVQETSSRYFTLADFIVNKLPPQVENADLYTLKEVAEIVSMSIVTIRQYVRTGKLKAVKQWRNWMVSSNEIARLLYEQRYGKKIPPGEPLLAAVDADLYEENGYIYQYKIITAQDILNNVTSDSSFDIDRYILSLIPERKSSCVFIEAISNIENFFRRTGEVPFKDFQEIDSPIFMVLPPNHETIEYIKENVIKLTEQTPTQALETIKERFGEPGDVQTTLKVYKALLDVCEGLLEEEWL
jgi:hypothetical protein